jgi:alkanesulfonate monooxygenase SsuD/methylene tetrahydromethanopterin reductase-like flavin-dependent oxidoreductase (luciferase family)
VNDEDLATVEIDKGELAPDSGRNGTMVIRVWTEEAHKDGFRARLTFTAGDGTDASVALAGDPEQVVEAVRNWLADTVS